MLKRLAVLTASLMLVAAPLFLPAAALAQSQAQSGGNFGLTATVNAVNGNGQKVYDTTQTDPSALIGTIIQRILQFTGVIFFILMLYAGFLWMTAQGDEKKVKEAKDIIRAAIIGLIIIGAAYAITAFVLNGIAPPQPGAGGTTPAGTGN